LLFKPDLVIASVALRKRSGLQLCKDIKSDENCKGIPCVLLKGVFDDAGEQDPEGVHADGVITKPFEGAEILRLVDKLTAEGIMKKKKESLLSELEKLDGDEIIELVEVVEEPESKVSINDLMAPEKEDLLGDIAPLETWEKPFKKDPRPQEPKEQPIRREENLLDTWERPLTKRQKPPEDELTLSFDESVGEKFEETELQLGKKELEDDFFEKVDLQDILAKVEEIKPTFAREAAGSKGTAGVQELPTMKEEPVERLFNFDEFETALQKGVKTETAEKPSPLTERPTLPAAQGEALPPFFGEEPKTETPSRIPPLETPVPETAAAHAAAPALPAEDLQPLLKEESLEEVPTGLAPSEAPLESEALTELPEEEFPEALLEEELKEEDVSIVQMPKEEPMGVIEEVQPPRVVPLEESVPVAPVAARPDKQAEELITKGIERMMEDFVKTIVPQIAQNIVTLTMERIEQMVKEIVPDLAQKAIQEEIRRLQSGEKD
jgi:CheY-like chemotaxis protein